MSSNLQTRFYTIELERETRRYELRRDQGHYLLIQNDGTETKHDSVAAIRRGIGTVEQDTRMTVRSGNGTIIVETWL